MARRNLVNCATRASVSHYRIATTVTCAAPRIRIAAIHAALTGTGKRHVVTSAVEHSSVLDYCMALERPEVDHGLHGSHGCEVGQPSRLPPAVGHPSRLSPSSEQRQAGSSPYGGGYRVTYLPVGRDGLLKLADLENAITDETAMKSDSTASRQMIRFSLGTTNTLAEFKNVLSEVERAVKMLHG